jgi:hypothetical protein
MRLFWFVCNVMTAFDPPFERLFYEDFNGGFRFKGGGVNTSRDIFNFLLSKVGICNMTGDNEH